MSFDDTVIDLRRKHADSIECAVNLNQQIMESRDDLMQIIELAADCRRKAAVLHHPQASLKVKADDLQRRLPKAQQHAMAQACKKGGSSTPTTIPVAEHGFFFDPTGNFQDHIHLLKLLLAV